MLLVTHSLQFIPDVDYIYCVQNGIIEEEGTFPVLMAKRGGLHRLVQEHVGDEETENAVGGHVFIRNAGDASCEEQTGAGVSVKEGSEKASGALGVQTDVMREIRTTGSVSLSRKLTSLIFGKLY